MNNITATDSVLLLLREKLERSARGRARSPATTSARPLSARDRIAALATAQSLSDEDLGHAAVRSLLEDRLGSELASEPGFEIAVREVVQMIVATQEGRALIQAACRQLLGS